MILTVQSNAISNQFKGQYMAVFRYTKIFKMIYIVDVDIMKYSRKYKMKNVHLIITFFSSAFFS